MYSQKKDFLPSRSIIGFTLPKLHRGKQWFVDFWVYNPTVDAMCRKKYMLGRYKNIRERESFATVLITNLYNKLITGWSPFVSVQKERHNTSFSTVVSRYYSYIDIAEKKDLLKHKSAVGYRSMMRQFETYLEESNINLGCIHEFDKPLVVDFLDYLVLDKDCSARTRNNYRGWLSSFASWLLERQYIDENPTQGIKPLREDDKIRDSIPAATLRKLSEYTKKHNLPFHLACLMEYYTFIRPNELRFIKIGDINISERSVVISSDFSKNRKTQKVALNDIVIKEMLEQEIFKYPSQYYLFGYNLTPSLKQLYVNRLRMEWNKVRDALHFPQSYQFYSLKDSGIRDLANSEGIVVARDQARHYDISITNKYLKRDDEVHPEAISFKGEL